MEDSEYESNSPLCNKKSGDLLTEDKAFSVEKEFPQDKEVAEDMEVTKDQEVTVEKEVAEDIEVTKDQERLEQINQFMATEKDEQLDIFLDSWFSEKSISARNAAVNSLKKR